jgi:formylglycine-generating enzyme required for sulfatase activity
MNRRDLYSIAAILGTFIGLAVVSQAADPVVSNIRSSQRANSKLVDIWYDVSVASGNQVGVTVAVSTNNGVAFDLPATSFSGAGYGAAVTPGNSRQITWNAGADWNGQYSSQVKFRVTATDVSGGNYGSMALIPAGNFQMGDTLDGESDALPVHTVYISAFYMDKYLVTKALWDSVYSWATAHGYQFDYTGSGKAASHPVQSVDWYDCVKWCNARSEQEGLTPAYYTTSAQTVVYRSGDVAISNSCVNWNATGYRLPTEAEWEKAARGGLSGQRFPWGNTISESQANYYGYTPGYSYDLGPNGYNATYATGNYPYTSPVGSFAANGYGLYDMAGNVWEWCWDRYGSAWYSNGGATQSDCNGPTSGSYRLLRGGYWYSYASYCRSAYRYLDYPAPVVYVVGFRCVRR